MVSKIGAPLSSSTAVPAQAPDINTVTVKKGDTLFSIAKKLGVAVEDLIAANPGLESGEITPGQQLTIPRPESGEPSEAPAPVSTGAAEKKEEAAQAEKAKAAELQSGIDGAAGKPLVAADGKKVLKEGSKGAEVKELQQQLNAIRKSAGLPEIAESGVYDAATTKAVKDFQDANPFVRTDDGKADVITRDLISLETSPSYKNLDINSQAAVNGLLSSWKDNPKARTNIMSIATDPSFGKLDTEKEVEAVLAKVSQNPETANVGSIKQAMKEFVTLKEDPNFQKLNTEVGDSFTRAFFAISPKTPQARQDLASMLKSPEFGKLSPDVQQKAGEAFFANSGDASFTKGVADLAGSAAFAGLPKDEQVRILETVNSNPDAALATALAEKARDGKLSGKEEFLNDLKKSAGVQDQSGSSGASSTGSGTDPMDGLSTYTRGQVDGLLESWKDNPVAKENLTRLATNPDFQKLSDEEQQVVLRRYIQNPQTELMDNLMGAVKEFSSVKADPNFQAMSDVTRENFTRAFFFVGLKNEQGRADLSALLKDPEFTKLPEDVQQLAGKAYFQGIDNADFSSGFRDLLGGKGFGALPQPEQERLLGTIRDNPDNRLVGELARLSRLGVLDNLGEEGLGALMQEFGLNKN